MLTKAQQLYKVKKPKRKKCKECKQLFTPTRDLQPCCGYDCEVKHIDSNLKGLVAIGGTMRQKEASKEKTKRKDKFLTENKSELEKILISKAETIVHKYIRLRDLGNNCISCNRQMIGFIVGHAGHYRPKGNNPQVRFYTRNIYLQCEECNIKKSANLTLYRQSLVLKYGNDFVEKLEANHTTKKYTVEYLKKLIRVFRKKIKLYERKFR